MFPRLRRWLTVLTIFYLFGAVSSCSTYLLADKFTEPRDLLAKVRPGMTPAEVEAIVGRPSEYKLNYACVPDCGPFSHNWTVFGHRVEVFFDRSGHATDSLAWHWVPGPVARIFGWVFFWWVPNLD
jgi:hypothetical protein